ncbi:MAG: hypothetical protein JRM80_11040, partial [Nitrososphaerota archaeon]|nr:hypothetical protein [Nitrososphaerota archaeon]
MKLLALLVLPILVAGFFAVSQGAFPPPAQPRGVAAPYASSPNSVWWVGASSTDSSALPNTGVRGTIQVISQFIPNVLDFWVSDDLSNNEWGQVGYYLDASSTPIAFYQIWNLNTNTVLTSGTTSVTTGSHLFSMYLQAGTTWAFSLDGTVFGAYDMGASVSSSSYPVYALSEEQATSVFSFPTVTFGPAMQVLKSGAWADVSVARSYGTVWGVQGAAQNPSMPRDEITVGTGISLLSSKTELWSSGGSTTTTTTSFSNPTSTVTTTVTATDTTTQTVSATDTVTSVSTSISTVTTPTTVTSTTTATQTVTS